MKWTKEQLLEHPNFAKLVGVHNSVKEVTMRPLSDFIKSEPAKTPEAPLQAKFTVPGQPVPKPRMTQSDVWKKRPCVLRYREFCDRIRAACSNPPTFPLKIRVTAYFPLPSSWSKKKKAELLGKWMRSKPDASNILKAVEDALFVDDCLIADTNCRKHWCLEGSERIEVEIEGTPSN